MSGPSTILTFNKRSFHIRWPNLLLMDIQCWVDHVVRMHSNTIYLFFLLAAMRRTSSCGCCCCTSSGGGRCGWHQMVVLSMILPGSFMIVFLLDRIETRRGRGGRHNHIVLLLGRVFKNKFLLAICKHNAQWCIIEMIKKSVCEWLCKGETKEGKGRVKKYMKSERDVSLGKKER